MGRDNYLSQRNVRRFWGAMGRDNRRNDPAMGRDVAEPMDLIRYRIVAESRT